MEEAGRHFFAGILSCLKSKALAPIYINFELDLWRYVTYNRGITSNHKGYKMYRKDELALMESLPNNWWFFLNKHGQGQAVKNPLKIKPVLSWTPATLIYQDGKLIQGPQMPLEKLCIEILKRPCDVHNLFE